MFGAPTARPDLAAHATGAPPLAVPAGPRSRRPGVSIPGLTIAGTVAACGLLWAPLPIELRWLGAYALLVIVPGWLLVRLALPSTSGVGTLERGLLALGAGYPLAMLVALAAMLPFRTVAGWQITALAVALIVLLALAATRRPGGWLHQPIEVGEPARARQSNGVGTPPSSLPGDARHEASAGQGAIDHRLSAHSWALTSRHLAVLFVIAVAGTLRVADLGCSEVQGDEARILLRAMAALQGVPDALAAHRKVPGEILLSLAFYGQLGAITELVGRLPFALAGVAGVAAFSVLARELFGARAGLVAGLLMAVNGYFVGFGRILQYDSVAFFLGTLGLLCCLWFARAERPSAGLALLGSLCLFGALLIALGAVFFVPPALILLAPAFRRVRHLPPRVFVATLWPIVPGVLAAGLVVWPTGEGTGGVWSYLGPRLGGSRPYWNLDPFLRSANHYLSTPYLIFTLTGGALFVLDATRRHFRTAGTRSTLLRLGAALGVAALIWDRPLAAGALAAAVLVGSLAFSPRVTLGGRVALAWAAGPLFVHLFLVRFSGTHWREAWPGLVLLTAAVLVALAQTRWSQVLVGLGLAVLLAGSAHFSWVTLVQRQPEYQLTFPRYRHPLDWAGGDGRGIGGVFGVAHRHGWKAVGVLIGQGSLPSSYATNESPAIAAWYVRLPQGCPAPPNVIFRVPRAPQDRNLPAPVALPEGYVTSGRVFVDGHIGITILVPPDGPPAGDAHLAGLDAQFDGGRYTSPWRPINALYRPDLGAAVARRTCTAAEPTVPTSR